MKNIKNIWILTAANLKKNKSQAISLLIFVLIAAMFLNIGLAISLGMGGFLDERAERVNMAHFTAIYLSGSPSIEKGLQFMEQYPSTAEIETTKAIGNIGGYFMNGIDNTGFIILSHMDESQKMDAPSFIGESRPLTQNSIYMPYFIFLNGGFALGDTFKLNLFGTELEFIVAGATEEIMFGAQFNTVYRFYISDENFAELEEKFFEGGLELVSMRLENEGDSMFFQAEYKKAISTEGLVYDFTYEMAKTARTMIPGIIAIIITAFALILLVVSLIVIRFRIINSIEESMINIGVQKAIGYKNLQIVLSIAAQFALIALCGGIMGIVTAQLAIPAIIKVLEPLIALVWSFEFDLGAALITMIFVLSAVSLISYVSARKINKLHPLVALRGGITTHSFKKNVFALDKAKGPLGFLLAAKQIAQQKKQSIAIAVIVAAVTMASVTGIAVNYNMTERRDDFARSLFGEMPDVSFMLNENSSGDAFKQRILEYSEVRKAFGYHTGETNLLVDETSIAATIVEDCDLLEGGMLISGRYPKHQNEIALGPAISKVSGKTIGDKAMVKCGEIEKKYLITGIVQFMNQVGFNGIITGEGLCEIQPDFKFTGYNVYLNDGVDTKAFIEKAKSKEGDIFDNIMDVYDNLKTTMDTMSDIFAAVAIGILGVTVFVVVLVLYMVIKTSIIHQKREFGIQKALGFVTFQLMNQIALNMSPIIFFGVLLGTLAGYFGLNPIFVALMSGMGVIRVQFEMPVLPIVAVCVALVMTAYAVSMLIAWRIRKISAYAFISE